MSAPTKLDHWQQEECYHGIVRDVEAAQDVGVRAWRDLRSGSAVLAYNSTISVVRMTRASAWELGHILIAMTEMPTAEQEGVRDE